MWIETNKVKKEYYLIRQDTTIYIFFKIRTRQVKTTEINKKVTSLN